MPVLKINNKRVAVPAGTTIYKAALKLGISIPTLCFMQGYSHYTSCMVCVVKEEKSKKIIPSCSHRVEEGMVIDTLSEEVKQARGEALSLLLAEHVGDCEAPCRRACPAFMDIPLMIRQIQKKKWDQALLTIRRHIPFASILGRICTAPCEKVCRRSQHDNPVSICLLKRFVGDYALSQEEIIIPYKKDFPLKKDLYGKKIAIVGAGPAGLTAAYYLLLEGYSVSIFEKEEKLAATLRKNINKQVLAPDILDRELKIVSYLGAKINYRTEVGKDISLENLKKEHDACIITTGKINTQGESYLGLAVGSKGIKVDTVTLQTEQKGVFAGGAAVKPMNMAIRSIASGRALMEAVRNFLKKQQIKPRVKRFDSRIGKLNNEELAELLKNASQKARMIPEQGKDRGFTEKQAVLEAKRCLHCDCYAKEDCELRNLAEEYINGPPPFHLQERKTLKIINSHPYVLFEPRKCIKCGRCVRITEKQREKLGLSFIGRGFSVQVEVPFNQSLKKGLAKTADLCVQNCPTGALVLKKSNKGEKK